MPTKRRNRPGTASWAAPTSSTSSPDSTGVNGHPLSDAQLLDLAYARGYRLAARCICCGKWLVDETSLRAHIGPAFRRRLDAQTVIA
jgi:hypothetical protein